MDGARDEADRDEEEDMTGFGRLARFGATPALRVIFFFFVPPRFGAFVAARFVGALRVVGIFVVNPFCLFFLNRPGQGQFHA